MKFTHKKTGYSLVEVLVAVAILMLAIVGPITIAAKNIQSAQFARQQNTAFFLAQEALSIATAIRNDATLEYLDDPTNGAWDWITHANLAPCFLTDGCNIDGRDETFLDNVVDCSTNGACLLQFNSALDRAKYQHVSGDDSPYTRVIRFETTNPDEVVVFSTVTWDSTFLGSQQEVTLVTSLYNIYGTD